MNDREFIMFFRKGAAFPINNQSAKTTLYHPVVPSPRLHPTQKPLGLMSDLITNSSQIGDVVLDPFMGVGTTCLAASILGRDYIGVEIDEQYYNIAVNLLDGE
jgi:site-specific DNA-methyltransferase (adenine-specific)